MGEKKTSDSIQKLKKELEEAKRRIELLEKKQSFNWMFEQFFNAAVDLVCIAGTDAYFKLINPAFERVLGYTTEQMLSKPFLSFVHPDDVEKTAQEIRNLQKGQTTINFENRYLKADGTYIYLQWVSTVPDPRNGHIFAVARDISEKKREMDKVRASEELLRETQKLAQMGSFEYNTHLKHFFCSSEFQSIFEVRETDWDSGFDVFLSRLLPDEKVTVLGKFRDCLQRGDSVVFEHSLHFPDNRIKNVLVSAIPIYSHAGLVSGFRGMVRDITEKKKRDEQLLNSLREKEVLIQEIHHRVKNNLQIITSLMNLQSNIIPDPKLKSYYSRSQARIKTMAFLHEALYQSGKFSKVDYSKYILAVTKDLLGANNLSTTQIKLLYQVPEILVDLRTAVPLGLISSEVISNAISHGCSSGSNPLLEVVMDQSKGGVVNLRISDSGAGFKIKDEPAETKDYKGLGLMLIDNLTKQLGGNYKFYRRNERFTFRLTFRI